MALKNLPDKCDICVTDKALCDSCKDNIKYRNLVPNQSFFATYIPVCPLGIKDCISDPAYIKRHYPEWYKDLYGDIPPEEAARRACSGYTYPCECYDDEDK